MEGFSEYFEKHIPLILLVDDSDFIAQTLNNFLWVAFTRVNPSHDVHGVNSFIENKHWGAKGAIVFDARIKPHHAPVLEIDKNVADKVGRIVDNIKKKA